MYLLTLTLDGDIWARHLFNTRGAAMAAQNQYQAAHFHARAAHGIAVPRLTTTIATVDPFDADETVASFDREVRLIATT